VKRDNRVVIVHCLVHNKPIRSLLALQNRRAEIPLRSLTENPKTLPQSNKLEKNQNKIILNPLKIID